MKLLINIPFISTFIYFIEMISSLRRPSFSKMFPNPVHKALTSRLAMDWSHNVSLVVSEGFQRFGRCDWTDIQAATESQHYMDFGRQWSLRK